MKKNECIWGSCLLHFSILLADEKIDWTTEGQAVASCGAEEGARNVLATF